MSQSKEADAVCAIQALIAVTESRGELLPNEGGALSLKVILESAGLTWNHLRRYEGVRKLLQAYSADKDLVYSRKGRVAPEEDEASALGEGVDMVPATWLRDVQTRLAAAERRNAELKAENASLRAQIMRGDEVSELIALGGRIKPGAL